MTAKVEREPVLLQTSVRRSSKARLPSLEVGDHLTQKTFHARYEAMETDRKYELIGGIVFMASPARVDHGRPHTLLGHWLGEYEDDTPGASALTNTSSIVDEQNEPQPDVCLLIEAECGGQTRIRRGWLIGAPELIAEVASSSESYDLHAKKESYERAGVKEYVVVALRQRRVFWFISQRGKFCELQPGNDGIFRSQVFPGLWLDPVALLKHQRKRVLAVLRRGLATPEHKAFVKMLAAKRKGRKP